ncbi:MAG: DALR anticodon-binding domain-containing protein [Candidatus Thorarchaeota archaeon]
MFSRFYDSCPVLKAEGDLKAARLELVRAFKVTMANCLSLLGIPVINRM